MILNRGRHLARPFDPEARRVVGGPARRRNFDDARVTQIQKPATLEREALLRAYLRGQVRGQEQRHDEARYGQQTHQKRFLGDRPVHDDEEQRHEWDDDGAESPPNGSLECLDEKNDGADECDERADAVESDRENFHRCPVTLEPQCSSSTANVLSIAESHASIDDVFAPRPVAEALQSPRQYFWPLGFEGYVELLASAKGR